jgi:hypothetical protein
MNECKAGDWFISDTKHGPLVHARLGIAQENSGKLVALAIAGQAERFDLFSRIRHHSFPGGALMRTPALVLGMMYYRLRDAL